MTLFLFLLLNFQYSFINLVGVLHFGDEFVLTLLLHGIQMRVSVGQSVSNHGIYLFKLGQDWRIIKDVVSKAKNDDLSNGVEGVCFFLIVGANRKSQKFYHQLSKSLQVVSESKSDICF